MTVVLLSGPDEDVIQPEGMEKFCEDIAVEPENVSNYLIIKLIFCNYLPHIPTNNELKGAYTMNKKNNILQN